MAWINQPQEPRWDSPSLREGNVSSIVAAIMAQRDKQKKDLQQIPSELAGAYKSWKNDQIAANLLQKEAGPDQAKAYLQTGMRPTDAYQMFQWDQEGQQRDSNTALDQQYKRAQIQALMAKQTSKTPEQTVPYDINGTTYQVPISRYLTHVENKTSPSAMLDKRLGQYGLNQDDLQNIDQSSLDLVDEAGNPTTDQAVTDEKKAFVTGQSGDKTFRIPRASLRSIYPASQNIAGNSAQQMYSPNSEPPSDQPDTIQQVASGPIQVKTKADYDALPSGAEYIAPDGSKRRKP